MSRQYPLRNEILTLKIKSPTRSLVELMEPTMYLLFVQGRGSLLLLLPGPIFLFLHFVWIETMTSVAEKWNGTIPNGLETNSVGKSESISVETMPCTTMKIMTEKPRKTP
mmetsp:Transcript_4287/g.11968  ORF Transcript_4287/g.11968 Transcript_4287/m.11968 type:complete len:110 (+) Transcript_4287:582-911(+)